MRSLPLFVCLAVACGSNPEPLPEFVPELVFSYNIASGPELDYNRTIDSQERSSVHLTADETLKGERYMVPDFLCLRADGTTWDDLPEAAVFPGEAAHFEVIYPPEGTENGTLVFMPHGDGLEFIEAFALEVWKEFPEVAIDNNVHPETGTQGVEQSTRYGAKRNMVSQCQLGRDGGDSRQLLGRRRTRHGRNQRRRLLRGPPPPGRHLRSGNLDLGTGEHAAQSAEGDRFRL